MKTVIFTQPNYYQTTVSYLRASSEFQGFCSDTQVACCLALRVKTTEKWKRACPQHSAFTSTPFSTQATKSTSKTLQTLSCQLMKDLSYVTNANLRENSVFYFLIAFLLTPQENAHTRPSRFSGRATGTYGYTTVSNCSQSSRNTPLFSFLKSCDDSIIKINIFHISPILI